MIDLKVPQPAGYGRSSNNVDVAIIGAGISGKHSILAIRPYGAEHISRRHVYSD